jgi:hypothetical protein
MKNHFLKHFFAMALATTMVVGCNNAGKHAKVTDIKGDNASFGAYDPAKLKAQIIEIIQNSPHGTELVDMLNKAGASYMVDITVPVESAEKMMTTTSKGLVGGMYGFDTKYASVYNRGDVSQKINNVLLKIIADLGIGSEIEIVKNYIVRIANNKSNKDSLEILTGKVFSEYHKQMESGSHADIYALTTIGSNIEALYILTQMSLYASDNSKFLELLNSQKERAICVYKLLETMSGDETLKPYFESIKPIMKFFEENKVIGNAELKIIAPEIEKLRNSII